MDTHQAVLTCAVLAAVQQRLYMHALPERSSCQPFTHSQCLLLLRLLPSLQLMMAGVLVDIVRQASEDGGAAIPCTEFHNRRLSEHADLQAEYIAWRQNTNTAALCSLCQVRACVGIKQCTPFNYLACVLLIALAPNL